MQRAGGWLWECGGGQRGAGLLEDSAALAEAGAERGAEAAGGAEEAVAVGFGLLAGDELGAALAAAAREHPLQLLHHYGEAAVWAMRVEWSHSGRPAVRTVYLPG